MGTADSKYVPDCRVSVDGSPLEAEVDARLARVQVDLDADLFARAELSFNDPKLALINGKLFASGAAVKIELGFASKLQAVFHGEVVALEPLFRRALPPSLMEKLGRGMIVVRSTSTQPNDSVRAKRSTDSCFSKGRPSRFNTLVDTSPPIMTSGRAIRKATRPGPRTCRGSPTDAWSRPR